MRNRLLQIMLILGVLSAAPASAENPPSFAQISLATSSVAESYFSAYIARDWDRLAPLLAAEGSFQDPTAALLFGTGKQQGREATLANFRQSYAAIRDMQFRPTRVFASGEHAVFEGSLDWTVTLEAGRDATIKNMPLIVILRVVDGKVVEHQDFADYSPFLRALRATADGG